MNSGRQEMIEECNDIIRSFAAAHGSQGEDLINVIGNINAFQTIIRKHVPGNETLHDQADKMALCLLTYYTKAANIEQEIVFKALKHYEAIIKR